mgnify:CR=1 FL=1
MGLARFVIILLIAAAGYWFWRRLRASSAARKARNQAPVDERSFVACGVCNVHVLKDRAFHTDGEWFCSAQHLEEHRSQHD